MKASNTLVELRCWQSAFIRLINHHFHVNSLFNIQVKTHYVIKGLIIAHLEMSYVVQYTDEHI